MRSIISSVFLAGQVLLPSSSRILTISQWSAFSPARITQQSSAMILPQNTIRVGSDTERVGYKACSHQSHFLFRTSGFRHASSVSKSSTSRISGRLASLRAPRGLSPAPSPMNKAPCLVLNWRSDQSSMLCCSPYNCMSRRLLSRLAR